MIKYFGKMIEIEFIKDTDLYKKGDIVKCNKDEAVEVINSGFAKYVKLQISKNGDKIPEIRTSSFYKNNEIIIEQIYNRDKKESEFLIVTKDKKLIRRKEYEFEGYKYLPINGEELELGIIALPSDIEYYGNVINLINEIKDFIYRYLDIDKSYLQFAAWYVLLSWVYDKFNTINYLRALGDTGTGKSRFLDVIGGLCYKNIRGSGATTVAALKRITKKWRGTIVIDEGDFRESDEKAELIKYFNLGFEKNRPLINCDKNDPTKLEFFIPYCPKIISTRQTFKDKALEARCLTKVMTQTDRDDIPVILFDSFFEEQQKLMNKLLKFRFDTLFKIDASKEVKLETKIKIEPRLRQATYSFVNLFSNNEKAMEEFIIMYKRDEMTLRNVMSELDKGIDDLFANNPPSDSLAEYWKNRCLAAEKVFIAHLNKYEMNEYNNLYDDWIAIKAKREI